MQELSGSNAPTANLLTGLGVDEIFTRTDSSTSTFLTDALGSTLALANSSGSVQTNYSYEPFDRAIVSGTASSNSFQYTGRENDGTGVYYYRARYYSPVYQRFVSEDPIGLRGGLNKYEYVGDDPVSGIDPTGRENPISHFAESVWAGLHDPSFAIAKHDPFNATSDVLTDVLPHSQDIDAYDTNMHAMAGRKSNGNWQSCGEALSGAADFIATMMNGDNLGMAEHTGQDWGTPSHGGDTWNGDYTSNHRVQEQSVLPTMSTLQALK